MVGIKRAKERGDFREKISWNFKETRSNIMKVCWWRLKACFFVVVLNIVLFIVALVFFVEIGCSFGGTLVVGSVAREGRMQEILVVSIFLVVKYKFENSCVLSAFKCKE